MKPVITFTADPYSLGDRVSTEVSRSLDWPIVAGEVFDDAAARCGAAPEKVRAALRDPPAFLGMSVARRKGLLACLGAAMTAAVLEGGVIYRGPAGHHLIRGVSHVIRVKITADLGDRSQRKAAEEGTPPERAKRELLAEDEGRLRSCREVFGEDCGDPVLYDLLLSTSELDVEAAAARIVRAAAEKRYQPQTWSIALMRDLSLSWEVRAALSKLDPDVLVNVKDGEVSVRTRAAESPESRICQNMRGIVLSVAGVKGVRVEGSEDLFGGRGKLIR